MYRKKILPTAGKKPVQTKKDEQLLSKETRSTIEKIKAAKKSSTPLARPDEENTLYVPQKYAGRVNLWREDDKIQNIGTIGLAPCISLVLYNPRTKSAMVAHFDSEAVGSTEYKAKEVAKALIKWWGGHSERIPTKITIVIGSSPDWSSEALVFLLRGACKEEIEEEPTQWITRTGDFYIRLSDGTLVEVSGSTTRGQKEQWERYMEKKREKPMKYDIVRLTNPLSHPTAYIQP